MIDRPRLRIIGVPFDPRTAVESASELLELVESSHSCAHVVTLNPEYVMTARHHSEFAGAIERADRIFADGVGIVLGARLLGECAVERFTGVQLVEQLAKDGTKLFFLGAGPGVAEGAAQRLRGRFANAEIVGYWDGGAPDPASDDESLQRIAQSGCKAVAVAYGAQGQVLWIDRNKNRLSKMGVSLAVGVGGAFDVLSGDVARAPERLRRVGLEWAWRLAKEPWRWRRMLVLPRFAALVMTARIRQFLR